MENEEVKAIRITEFLTSGERVGYVTVGALCVFIGVELTKAACHAIATGIVGKDVTTVNGKFEVEK